MYFQILLIGFTFYFQHVSKLTCNVLIKNVKKTNIIALRVKLVKRSEPIRVSVLKLYKVHVLTFDQSEASYFNGKPHLFRGLVYSH